MMGLLRATGSAEVRPVKRNNVSMVCEGRSEDGMPFLYAVPEVCYSKE